MKRLYVLRHAKSSWGDDGVPDRDRPLAPRGRRAAARMAEYLAARNVAPGLVLCSPALRTRQTLEAIRPALPERARAAFDEELYGATALELLERVRAVPARAPAVLLIGHNPGVQELVLTLARDGAARERAARKLPTAALAVLQLDGGWKDLAPGRCELLELTTPKDLE